MRQIRRAAVIGSGVMGASIAAHLANAGIPSLLLDLVPNSLTEAQAKKGLTLLDPLVRNSLAIDALARLKKANPAPFYDPLFANRITPGNLEDHLSKIADVDWVIEVIVESLEPKQSLLARIEEHWHPGIIVSSNTSGISINEMVQGLDSEFRRHFLGTHFFNPPRYMKLLEVIPGDDTDPDIVEFMTKFCERRLGKGVVRAKDTPNFVANRIGTYGLLVTLQEMMAGGFTVEEVDAVTGPAIGRPKSATFRTLDLVGIDTFVHVANNVLEKTRDEAEKTVFRAPSMVVDMVQRGWIGEKAGQGFYRKQRVDGKSVIDSLNLRAMEYGPQVKFTAPSLEAAKAARGAKAKIRALLGADDKYARLARSITARTLIYAAEKVGEIADSPRDIDDAMKWGFNWDLGPFEIWDALGLVRTIADMESAGMVVPAWVKDWVAAGHTSFYERRDGHTLVAVPELGGALGGAAGAAETAGAAKAAETAPPAGNPGAAPAAETAPPAGDPSATGSSGALVSWRRVDEAPEIVSLAALKEQGRVVARNSGSSLVDLGDGVACLEFHSPNNAIGEDILVMIQQSMPLIRKDFEGLVVANQGRNFCVGANLMILLMEAQNEEWEEVDDIIRMFQHTMLALKRFEKPVVAAPHRMTLGGGVEVCLAADRILPAAETYFGLVEVGVGLIPGGGGCKELAYRLAKSQPSPDSDLQPGLNHIFETVGMAKVSTSGHDAIRMGLMAPTDRVVMNQDFAIHEAKAEVLRLAEQGYAPPTEERFRVAGSDGKAVLTMGAYDMFLGGYISNHDLLIARKLAHVLAGGDVPAGTMVTEEYMLDLEREAFLSLVGEPKTQARMQHMLAKGKPLRN